MVVYFYGHTKRFGYFSNFYPSKIIINANIINKVGEIEAHTAEQAIMWIKAKLMDDETSANAIALETSPAKCKALGRKVKPFDFEKWNKYRNEIAFEILKLKFNIEIYKKLLLVTGDEIIAEAAPRDKIWGIGISVEDGENGKNGGGKIY